MTTLRQFEADVEMCTGSGTAGREGMIAELEFLRKRFGDTPDLDFDIDFEDDGLSFETADDDVARPPA